MLGLTLLFWLWWGLGAVNLFLYFADPVANSGVLGWAMIDVGAAALANFRINQQTPPTKDK